jgi:hypothetical protein
MARVQGRLDRQSPGMAQSSNRVRQGCVASSEVIGYRATSGPSRWRNDAEYWCNWCRMCDDGPVTFTFSTRFIQADDADGASACGCRGHGHANPTEGLRSAVLPR